MDIRHYLSLLRRQYLLVILSVVIVGAVAGATYAVREPLYRSTASVVLVPHDPLTDFLVQNNRADAKPQVDVEGAFVKGFPVAQRAGAQLGIADVGALLRSVSVATDTATDVIKISATDPSPARAQAIANAVVAAFVEERATAGKATIQQVVDQLDKRLTDLRAQIAEMEQEIAAQEPTAPSTAGAASTASSAIEVGPPGSLAAARYALGVQYQQVFERQQSLLVERDVKGQTVQVGSFGGEPRSPIGTGALQTGAMAVLVGLLLGLALAVLREYLDDRIRSRDEVEELAHLPILADLPSDPDADDGVSCLCRPASPLAESARVLRTNLQFLDAVESAGAVVVTSPGIGDGKTFVAANLAVLYAQAGYRTTLVSADLRRPRLETLFDVADGGVGLTGILASRHGRARRGPVARATGESAHADVDLRDASWSNGGAHGNGAVSDALVALRAVLHVDEGPSPAPLPEPGTSGRSPIARSPSGSADASLPASSAVVTLEPPGLRFVASGPLPPNPAELLSAQMAGILGELAADADVVVLDSPPVLPVTDASILATQADGVVLVVALLRTRRSDLRRALRTLDQSGVRVLGVVVNRASSKRSRRWTYAAATPDAVRELAVAAHDDR